MEQAGLVEAVAIGVQGREVRGNGEQVREIGWRMSGFFNSLKNFASGAANAGNTSKHQEEEGEFEKEKQQHEKSSRKTEIWSDTMLN